MATAGFSVLMIKRTADEVSCPRCTSSGLGARKRLSLGSARSEIDKVYRGWHCGCRTPPENHIVVHVQGPNLEYLKLCAGCASELTGIPKHELLVTP
jgi:hypothetical protein